KRLATGSSQLRRMPAPAACASSYRATLRIDIVHTCPGRQWNRPLRERGLNIGRKHHDCLGIANGQGPARIIGRLTDALAAAPPEPMTAETSPGYPPSSGRAFETARISS